MPGPMNSMGGGQNFAFPDVCKTPTPAGPVPIPYPNIAMPNMTMPTTAATKVLASNMPTCNMGSTITMSQGDNAGVAMGVVSNLDMGPCKYTMGSTSVLLQNQPAATMASMTGQNGSSPNAVGSTIVPSQATVIVGA